MNDILDLMRYDPTEDTRRRQFVSQVCLYLGQDTDEIRELATRMFGRESRNPKWGAVLVLKNLVGPLGAEMVKDFALRMGFQHY